MWHGAKLVIAKMKEGAVEEVKDEQGIMAMVRAPFIQRVED